MASELKSTFVPDRHYMFASLDNANFVQHHDMALSTTKDLLVGEVFVSPVVNQKLDELDDSLRQLKTPYVEADEGALRASFQVRSIDQSPIDLGTDTLLYTRLQFCSSIKNNSSSWRPFVTRAYRPSCRARRNPSRRCCARRCRGRLWC